MIKFLLGFVNGQWEALKLQRGIESSVEYGWMSLWMG